MVNYEDRPLLHLSHPLLIIEDTNEDDNTGGFYRFIKDSASPSTRSHKFSSSFTIAGRTDAIITAAESTYVLAEIATLPNNNNC